MKEKLTMIGYADFEIIDHYTKKILHRGRSYNMVVNNGLTRIRNLTNGLSVTPFTKIAIGTDSTVPAETQTALISQYEIKDAVCGSELDYKATWEATFSFVTNITIREVGVFTSDSIMLDRVIFADELCGSGKDFHVKITLEYARA